MPSARRALVFARMVEVFRDLLTDEVGTLPERVVSWMSDNESATSMV